jgi:ribosomal protein S18 acetylase RimI-like enzyme
MGKADLEGVSIRTELKAGDIGLILQRHGELYARENGYGRLFELYVGRGLCEFLELYDPNKDRLWICERSGRMAGSLVAVRRGEAVQLRYFLLEPECRGIGLGRKLMGLCLEFARERGYASAYLWTTEEQEAAIRLYESFGFKLTEEKASTAFGKSLRELRYDLALG